MTNVISTPVWVVEVTFVASRRLAPAFLPSSCAAGRPACAPCSAAPPGLGDHATAAAFGISALLANSATAYSTLKFIGIVYLLYLGIRMLLTTGQHADEDSGRSQGRPFAQGLLSNALNPKIALFFLTFLPQFLPDHGATLPAALGLSAVFAALYLTWFSGLIGLVGLVGNALRKPSVRARMDRITAGALIAFGIRLAAQGKH